MSEDNFRRTLRIPTPVDKDDIDSLLIAHLKKLEAVSPFRMQEWIRCSLRKSITEETLALFGGSDATLKERIELLVKIKGANN